MVTRNELVEIIARQQEGGKLLDSHTCMGYCVESMEETYCSTSSSQMKQSQSFGGGLDDKTMTRSTASLTGSFNAAVQ